MKYQNVTYCQFVVCGRKVSHIKLSADQNFADTISVKCKFSQISWHTKMKTPWRKSRELSVKNFSSFSWENSKIFLNHFFFLLIENDQELTRLTYISNSHNIYSNNVHKERRRSRSRWWWLSDLSVARFNPIHSENWWLPLRIK